MRDDASPAAVAALAAKYGVAMRPNSAWSRTHDQLEVADVDPAREGALIDALSRDPLVEHVEPMAVYRETFVPNDPLYASKQWHLRRVGAEKAWSYTCGQGITVAVVDTGIACFDKGPFSRGTDLAGTRCEGGWNFVTDTREAADDQGHGDACRRNDRADDRQRRGRSAGVLGPALAPTGIQRRASCVANVPKADLLRRRRCQVTGQRSAGGRSCAGRSG